MLYCFSLAIAVVLVCVGASPYTSSLGVAFFLTLALLRLADGTSTTPPNSPLGSPTARDCPSTSSPPLLPPACAETVPAPRE
mmetsp:Transcript_32732/g.64143  ORF Transcript_32732/g.64143 Transcript_32732/m.64143 type:complete len:82 (-) Transcript_32732:2122-2367(-)